MIFLYYIFLIFQILKIKAKEINFKIPIEYTSDYEPLINMCLGTPPQCLKFKILTYLNYSYVLNKTKYNHGFDSNKSDSFLWLIEYHISKPLNWGFFYVFLSFTLLFPKIFCTFASKYRLIVVTRRCHGRQF